MYGFYRIAAVSPELRVADVSFNTKEIIRCGEEARRAGACLTVFPELSLTGTTCGDLFYQPLLLDEAWKGLETIAEHFRSEAMILVVGLPVLVKNQVYNCAAVLQNGDIMLSPKRGNDPRFADGAVLLDGLVSTDHVFSETYRINECFTFGIEIGDDWRKSISPGAVLAEQGVALICNLSAGNRTARQAEEKRQTFGSRAGLHHAIYLAASSGVHESTTDAVCDGQLLIAEDDVIVENERYSRKSDILYRDVDFGALQGQRLRQRMAEPAAEHLTLEPVSEVDELKYRHVDPLPFLMGGDEACRESFRIQCHALAKRLEITGSQKAVLGLSGGLDSTLAFLVAAETFKLLGRDPGDVLALTMPGFGTTNRTKGNAEKLAECLKAELRTVDIKAACLQHFADIGHDPADHSVTYENTQARERTQILMDVANRERGLLIGTGDLSEIALGWSTYNGDHMSMYSVNCTVSKTAIRAIVKWYAESQEDETLRQVLLDILATPVSPELLPADEDGGIQQKTETILGAYELHDFYLYHIVRNGADPEKVLFLAKAAFGNTYPEEEIRRTLQLFIRRFFTQQFKRSCSCDGPVTGPVSLSPRTDWKMPSDASAASWLARLETEQKG